MANIKTIDDVPSIILYTPLEKADEQEKNWKELYFKFLNEISDKPDDEVDTIITSITSNDTNSQAQVSIAIMYGMMVDQQQCSRYFQILNTITRDRYSLCVSHMKKLICEKFHRLQPFAQDQIIWIVSEFINHSANECHVLVQQLLRHIITGNTSQRNMTLIQQMLNLCIQYKDWLYEQHTLIPIVWYTFMSLIYDHYPQQFDSIRDKEISLCTQLIRERFDYVKIIGRDLIRVLFNVSKIPQFESVWNDIILAPSQSSNIDSSISNLRVLLHTPTPRHILASRLTPEMETWLLFMMKEVKMSNVKRYQQWFSAKFFPNPLTQTLAPDLIRYICGVWHPPNHILSSDITPRYFQIGWILKTVNAQMWRVFSTQALLYDWYFFVKGKDGIMNIEPAILLMVNSLKRHPEITAQCIEQICVGMNTLIAVDQNIKDDVVNGIQSSVKILLENKVVHSVEPICNLPGLNQHLRDQLKSILGPFLNKEQQGLSKAPTQPQGQTMARETKHEQSPLKSHNKSLVDELFPEVSKQVQNNIKEEQLQAPPKIKEESSPKIELPSKTNEVSEEDVFSGWSDKVANIANEIIQTNTSNKIIKDVVISPLDSVNIPENIPITNYKEIFSTICKMMDEGNVSSSQSLFDTYLKCLGEETDVDAIDTGEMGRIFVETFIDEFKETNPFNNSNELVYPRIFSAYNKGNSPLIKKLLCDIRDIEPSIGYRFLCYASGKENIGSDDSLITTIMGNQMDLVDEDEDEEDDRLMVNLQSFIDLHNRQIEKDDKDQRSIYDDYLDFIKAKEVKKSSWKNLFLEDCQLCAQANVLLFMELIPYLFRYFSDYTVGNIEFIKLVTTFTYPEKLLSIECQVSASDYAIIGDSLDQLLLESLEWESFSQIALWRIIMAEFVSEYDLLLATIIPFLKKLDHIKHSEAILGITTILLSRPPKTFIMETLLILPIRLSRFVCTILTRWNRTELYNVPKKEESASLRKYIIWSEQLTQTLTEALQSINKNSKYSSAKRKMLIRKAMTHLTLLKSIIREEAVDLFVSHDKLVSTIIELISQNQVESEFEDLFNTLTENQ